MTRTPATPTRPTPPSSSAQAGKPVLARLTFLPISFSHSAWLSFWPLRVMLPASQSACVTVEVAAIATEARTRLPITAITATRAASRFVMDFPPRVGGDGYVPGAPYVFGWQPAMRPYGPRRGPRDPPGGDPAFFRARPRRARRRHRLPHRGRGRVLARKRRARVGQGRKS